MGFSDDVLQGLFPGKKNRIGFKENFVVSEEYLNEVDLWMDSGEGRDALAKVYQNYHLKKAGIPCEPEVHILRSPYANGFALNCQKTMTGKIFSNLFFAFGQRMLALGYRKVSLDRKMQEISDQVKVTEKLYFKPDFVTPRHSDKINQLFGNVTIEKVYIDDKPDFLKVLVTVYSDRLYDEARPFDQYIEHLFKADE
ncbi:hypothetical protein [Negadavirga shengliensis]|uniref:Uncharacterized protein n=1 Tax=Negadavirga shengliensis TaxID=1389218 RepID=A0ABV9T396_9BACT